VTETARGEATRHFLSINGLLKIVGAVHGSIACVQFALVNGYWKPLALCGVVAVWSLVSADCRFLWSSAPWYRISLILHVVFQLTMGIVSYLQRNQNISTIALMIGWSVFFLLLPAMLEYAREQGIKPRRNRGADSD
jgi:hypothetical protein